MEVLDKNMKKKVKKISDDQFIEMMEQSWELQVLNDGMAKKIIIRDLIRNRIQNLKVADKFKEFDDKVADNIPKLACVLASMFCD